MPDAKPMPTEPMPISLGDHVVPPERLSGIKAHMALLSAKAIEVSDMLPLEADASDMIAVLEAEGE